MKNHIVINYKQSTVYGIYHVNKIKLQVEKHSNSSNFDSEVNPGKNKINQTTVY